MLLQVRPLAPVAALFETFTPHRAVAHITQALLCITSTASFHWPQKAVLLTEEQSGLELIVPGLFAAVVLPAACWLFIVKRCAASHKHMTV